MGKINPFGASKLPKEKKMVRYSDKELAEFKVHIEKKLETVSKEYFDAKTRLENLKGDEPGDIGDFASLSATREEVGREKIRAFKLKKSLEGALIRVANKSYGIDRETGNLIPKERLMVALHATLDACTKNDHSVH